MYLTSKSNFKLKCYKNGASVLNLHYLSNTPNVFKLNIIKNDINSRTRTQKAPYCDILLDYICMCVDKTYRHKIAMFKHILYVRQRTGPPLITTSLLL